MDSHRDTEDNGRRPDDLAVLREESRCVLDYQIRVVRGIDERAMWLVRTAVIVISVVVSGAGIAGRSFLARHWAAVVFATLGVGALVFVSVWGSILFAVSRVPFGPSRSLTKQLSSRTLDSNARYRVLLQGYEKWIDAARREAESNANAFTSIQIGFVLAVSLATSGMLVATSAVTDVGQVLLTLIGLLLTVGLVLYISITNLEARS